MNIRHTSVRDRIEALRAQQDQERSQTRRAERHLHQERTDKTKEVLLAAKERRIRELEEENRKLLLMGCYLENT